VVLLAVLGALGMIYILVVQMSADVMFTSRYYQKVLFKEKAYYISRSAFTGLRGLFMLDNAKVDSLHDIWAQEIPPYDLADENVQVIVKVEDLERYVNPNIILSGTNPKKENIQFFRRLLGNLQIEPDLTNALIDWIDRDQNRRIPMGADGLDYPRDMPSKGRDLDSIEEIKLIKGIGKYYSGKVIFGRAYPGLKDVLTVNSNGKININTAASEILLSLDDEMNSELVAEIIRRREAAPIEKLDELIDVAGMTHDLMYRIKKFATVKSNNFRAIITVESFDGNDSAELVVIFNRSNRRAKIKFWQAQ